MTTPKLVRCGDCVFWKLGQFGVCHRHPPSAHGGERPMVDQEEGCGDGVEIEGTETTPDTLGAEAIEALRIYFRPISTDDHDREASARNRELALLLADGLISGLEYERRGKKIAEESHRVLIAARSDRRKEFETKAKDIVRMADA